MGEAVEAALPVVVRECIPKAVESNAATVLALGYGLTFSVLHAIYPPDGGWLPALGIMPPVWQQQPPQVTTAVAEQMLYGIGTVAAYRWLQESR